MLELRICWLGLLAECSRADRSTGRNLPGPHCKDDRCIQRLEIASLLFELVGGAEAAPTRRFYAPPVSSLALLHGSRQLLVAAW